MSEIDDMFEAILFAGKPLPSMDVLKVALSAIKDKLTKMKTALQILAMERGEGAGWQEHVIAMQGLARAVLKEIEDDQ